MRTRVSIKGQAKFSQVINVVEGEKSIPGRRKNIYKCIEASKSMLCQSKFKALDGTRS